MTQLYYSLLDQELIDYHPFLLGDVRFRGPPPDLSKPYFTCLGSAYTFGRYCENPYPRLLSRSLNIPALNMGRGGVSPAFYLQGELLTHLNNSVFCIIQIMSARAFDGSDKIYPNVEENAHQLWRTVIKDQKALLEAVTAARDRYVVQMIQLLTAITVPKILFWFSKRTPTYQINFKNLHQVFGHAPQLVNQDMVDQIKPYTDRYVTCVTDSGLPHDLIKDQTLVYINNVNGMSCKNSYYPSQQMHLEAATSLEPAARSLIGNL